METTERLYRVAVNGAEIGEYPVEELRSYWTSGSLDRAALYLHTGTQQWRPVSQMFGAVPQRVVPGNVGPSPRYAQDGSLLVKTARSRGIYVVLGIFFGGLGIHNFYAGRYGTGVAQLGLMLLTGWLILTIPVIWFWVLVELFVVTKDGAGDPMS